MHPFQCYAKQNVCTSIKAIKVYLIITLCSLLVATNACKREPFKPDFEHAAGYVIKKEICKSNADEDYWLVDLSYPLNTVTNYGDTITIDGRFYTNMIKSTKLPASFKEIGKHASFDFYISDTKIETIACTVVNPVTYNLKEIQIKAFGIW
jgi:hypothetical protein